MPSGSDRDAVVEVEHLSVRFKTFDEDARSYRAKLWHRRKSKRTIDALRDVTFDVPKGSVFGVVGSNGSGKSTLFRVIAGVIPPNEGRVALRSRVTPLLSLGLGFNQRLTGRENIRMGGLIQGLTPEVIEERVPSVIEFSELGKAIDRPMRTYSAGMAARLGFSVAIHLEPDLVLIDEALAAGDAKFKEKCTERIVELCQANTTVMLVSHGMAIVKSLATECLWLEDGEVRQLGPADDVIGAYIEAQHLASQDVAMEDM